jgi:hypothetical protein
METESKFYSQQAIAVATYFGGPLAAGILIKSNFLTLGKPDQARNSFYIGLISTILIFAGIFSIPEHIIEKFPNALIPAVYTLIIFLIVKKLQGKELDEHKENGGEFYSFWKSAKVGAISMVIIFAGIALVAFISGDLSKNSADFDAITFDKEIAIFMENENKALAVFEVFETSSKDYLVKEFNKNAVIWKQNKTIIENLQNFKNIPLELIEQNNKLIKYSDLRIEQTDLFIKAALEDTDIYFPEINKIDTKIQKVIEELRE